MVRWVHLTDLVRRRFWALTTRQERGQAGRRRLERRDDDLASRFEAEALCGRGRDLRGQRARLDRGGGCRTGTMLPIGARSSVLGRVARLRPRESRLLQGWTTTPTGPSGVVGRTRSSSPASSTTSVRPSTRTRRLARSAGSRPRARRRTASQERRISSSAVPVWTMRPSTSTAIRSASAAASEEVVRDEDRREPELVQERRAARPAPRPRVCGSRRPSARRGAGSVGSRASARARATALPLAAGELGRLRLARGRRSRAARADRADSPPAEGHVALDDQVREQRVLLEHEARRRAFGPAVDPPLAVEPDLAVRRDEPRATASRARRSRAGPSSCPRLRGRRARPSRRRRRALLDVEVANRNREIEPSRAHVNTFRPTQYRRPTMMKSALIARATSKSVVELRVDRERQRLGHPLQAAGEDRASRRTRRARARAPAPRRRRARRPRAAARSARTSRHGPAPSVRAAAIEVLVDASKRCDRPAQVERALDERDREHDGGLREPGSGSRARPAARRAARSARTPRGARCPRPPAAARAAARSASALRSSAKAACARADRRSGCRRRARRCRAIALVFRLTTSASRHLVVELSDSSSRTGDPRGRSQRSAAAGRRRPRPPRSAVVRAKQEAAQFCSAASAARTLRACSNRRPRFEVTLRMNARA